MKIYNSTLKLYLIGTILILGVLIVSIIIYYSFNSGNFTMPIDTPSVASYDLRLAETPDFENMHVELSVSEEVDALGMTYKAININDITQSEGVFMDDEYTYLAYSFYIMNSGTTSVTIDYYMRLVEVISGMDEFVRILVIEDDEVYTMYQKEDNQNDQGQLPTYVDLPTGIHFESWNVVLRDSFSEFRPGDVKLFRVVLWLESQDPDLDELFLEGSLKSVMTFRIRNTEQEISLNNEPFELKDTPLWIPMTTICSVTFEISSKS